MFSLCKNLALGGTSTAWELEVGAGKQKERIISLALKKVVISFLAFFLFNLAIWAQNKFHRNIYFSIAQMAC